MDRYGFARAAIFGADPCVRGTRLCGWLHECTAVYVSTSSGRLPLVEPNHPRTQGRRRDCLTSRLLSAHNCMPLERVSTHV
jgi:hypothetical protein